MLTRRVLRAAVVTAAVGIGIVLLFEVTILDSRYAARRTTRRETAASSAPGARLVFSATAYCKGTTTATGAHARAGIVAADPDILPLGSVVRVDSLDERYDGIYTVLDTGPMVQGRDLDVYMWSCYEALAFGRQNVKVTILRFGWSPRATAPETLDPRQH